MDLASAITGVSAQFDTTTSATSDTVIRSWIHAALQDAVARAKWRKVVRSLGVTVAGQATYEVDEDVVGIRTLRVGASRPWLRVGTEELWELEAGNALLRGAAGAFAPMFEDVAEGGAVADGDPSLVSLWPVPTEAGLEIEALAAVLPPPIVAGTDTATVLPVPEDLARQIAVDGAIAIGMREALGRHEDAAQYTVRFEAAVNELSRRANSRIGRGPVQVPVGRRR